MNDPKWTNADFYRAPNKRIIRRGAGGRFREGTVADIGMACCESCGAIFAPDLSKLQNDGFVNPAAVRESRRLCEECRAKASEVAA